jgi:hypothetical protein
MIVVAASGGDAVLVSGRRSMLAMISASRTRDVPCATSSDDDGGGDDGGGDGGE